MVLKQETMLTERSQLTDFFPLNIFSMITLIDISVGGNNNNNNHDNTDSATISQSWIVPVITSIDSV